MHGPKDVRRRRAGFGADAPEPAHPGPAEQRLDVWLDVACLFKTRSEAQKACKGGKVEVNREPGRPHRQVRPGDEVRITRAHGKQIVVVSGLAEHHVPKAQARELYRDVTPPPSPEEIEMRRFERLARPPRPLRRPDKRERRALRRFKGF
jgi:ribosome-associated heat shock protein Hsp15